MSEPPVNPRMAIETHADPDLEAGSYANALAIWHTAHEFTFDFLVTSSPPQPGTDEAGAAVIRAPHRLVARIRVPPTAVFDIIRTINENLTMYERRFGQIRQPGGDPPLYPPEDPPAPPPPGPGPGGSGSGGPGPGGPPAPSGAGA